MKLVLLLHWTGHVGWRRLCGISGLGVCMPVVHVCIKSWLPFEHEGKAFPAACPLVWGHRLDFWTFENKWGWHACWRELHRESLPLGHQLDSGLWHMQQWPWHLPRKTLAVLTPLAWCLWWWKAFGSFAQQVHFALECPELMSHVEFHPSGVVLWSVHLWTHHHCHSRCIPKLLEWKPHYPGPVGNNFWCLLSTTCRHLELHSCVSWSTPKGSRWSHLWSPSSTCNLLWMLEWLVLPHLCAPFVRARLSRPPWLVWKVASSFWWWCMVCRTPVFQSGAECPGVGPLLPCGKSGPWRCVLCIGEVCLCWWTCLLLPLGGPELCLRGTGLPDAIWSWPESFPGGWNMYWCFWGKR